MPKNKKQLSANDYAEAMKGHPSVEFTVWKKAAIELMQAAGKYTLAEADFFKARDKRAKENAVKGKKR